MNDTRDAELAEHFRALRERAATEAAALPPANVQPTRYEVSCVPEGIDRAHFSIHVEYRGRDLWAVTRHRECLAADGTWSWESIPSEREDEWLARHRFDLDTALELAKQVAPLLTVNGFTVTEAIAMEARRNES
ncbi:hypothetical protein K378_01394 [Streptomyces sp. Amel2xB2]|uniref:hypothetical protein n=1 Tax=Streptomyces sp. Amel2xB2 TaxID=1305829 RepID=UPI000DB98890|nr:hypothetical protein [Streptomyces sp. Amel2xB2]RAJ70229.1 hypothetical protein K378_01394 [Streptomyces sp. Amel2xB2]